MNNRPTILEASGISRRAGDRWLLHDMSLTLAAGERVAVVGPTGSGKSLLLRCLALLDPIDSGEIRFRESPIAPAAVPTFRCQVVYLHQRPALIEGTVEDNLRRALQLKVHRQRALHRGKIVEWLGLLDRDESFLRQSTAALSGGEAQLVALLRAMQLEPLVLLLDEPTSALDAASARAVEQLIGTWHADRPAARALIWVDHDAQQVGRVSDRVLQMEQGRLRTAEPAVVERSSGAVRK